MAKKKIAPEDPGTIKMEIDPDAAKASEAVSAEVDAIAFRELTAADLTLIVQKQELGILETNAEAIKAAILSVLPSYTPENYIGRLDALKKDKAALNNAASDLNARRLQLERDFNKPFERFKSLIAEAVKEIQKASAKLDAVAKDVEREEKEVKRKQIDEYWRIKEFPFPDVFEKIFDERWLNKTMKKADIFDELDKKCDKIIADIKLLERFPAEDIPTVKAHYLEHLDMAKAMDEADRLKRNREAAEKEAAEREERERNVALQKQMRAEAAEYFEEQREAPMRALAAAASGSIATPEQAPPEVTDPVATFTLEFTGKTSALREMREFMTKRGITYRKIEAGQI
jgi:hypothetical protein